MGLIELKNEQGNAIVSSHAGATLRSLKVNVKGSAFELLSGGLDEDLDAATTPSGVGSFIMAPWVNRIHEGRLVTEHGEHQLPVNSGIHAIHGTVRRSEWEVVKQTDDASEMRIDLSEPWPFQGEVVYRVSLVGASLRQVLEVRAAKGERAFPAGAGWHPWFKRSIGSEEALVQLDAAAQWELNPNVVPSGAVNETPAVHKLRDGGRFEVGELDDCFMLGKDRTASLQWPELTLRMESSQVVTHAMVYTPEDSICVEPQTTAVNAFQLAAKGVKNTGTVQVFPGNPLIAETVWSWSTD